MPGVKVVIFGSRARGDYRPDSDVDLRVTFTSEVTDETVAWWGKENESGFVALQSQLPGGLEICDGPPKLLFDLDTAEPVRVMSNVSAVVLPQKPRLA